MRHHKEIFVLTATQDDEHHWCKGVWYHKPTPDELRKACPENAPESLITALVEFQSTVFENNRYNLNETCL
jgi:hypothetical protein